MPVRIANQSVIYVAAFAALSQIGWYSPGRQRKIEQVWTMLSDMGFDITGLNIAPHVPSTSSAIRSLCKAGSFPFRFIQLAISSTRFFLHCTPCHTTAFLWLYNTRSAESIVAIIGTFLRPGLKLVLQLEDLPSARNENHGLAGLVDSFTTVLLSRRAHHIFAVSQNVADSFHLLTHQPCSKISILPPGLDPLFQRALSCRSEPFTNPKIQILYAGSFAPEKGVEDLIQAFIRLDPALFELCLVGVAPKDFVEHWEKQPSIVFMGPVSNKILFDLYLKTDVTVNPHRPILRSEHVFPFKLVEIVASGALPLTTPVPGSHTFSLPKDCFFHDVEELAEKLNQAPQIWRAHRPLLRSVSSACRLRYSKDNIQQHLSAVLIPPAT
jgi:glycosyltransferase involved in cell wall biosynthesis